MARIQFVNTGFLDPDQGTEVEVHSTTCQHLGKYRAIPLFDAVGDGGQMDAETALDTFTEYNADFLAEDPAGALPITVFPCSALVDEKTTITHA